MNKNKPVTFFTFLMIISGCAEDPVKVWKYTSNENDSGEITREYVEPVKILWVSDSTGNDIVNHSALLEEGKGQADLVGHDLCILKGNEKRNPAILFDFGRELHGGLEIVTGMFEGKEPIKVRVTFGESVSEALSRVESSSATNDHAMRDFELPLPWLGKIEVGNTGFRFLKIELLDPDRTLKLKEVRAISIYRDIPYLGSFKSNDERLNQIWETGAYTVHLNMQDYLWDGIKRDRLVWVGDMHPEVMTILSVFGYNEVVPKSLDFIKEITELPAWMNGISSYSMWWILIHYQWYLNTGDIEYLENNKEYIYELLSVLEEHINDDGKETLDGNRFLDWPTSPNKPAIHAGLQSMMAETFEKAVLIAEVFDDREKSRHYAGVRDKLLGYIPSPNGSKSAGALMAISGLADPSDVNDTLLSVDPYENISTFYGYYVLRARALAGDAQGAMDVIRKYWGGMLDLGATTFWEDFNLSWMENAARIDQLPDASNVDIHSSYGDYCYVGLRNSYCHGWASGPTAWMTEFVLGIKVLEPGCKKIMIDPDLGDLEWVEGTYPTPYGLISVRHEKDENGNIKSNIDAPEGVEVIQY